MQPGVTDGPDSTMLRRRSPAIAALLVAVLVVTGLFGASTAAAASMRSLLPHPAITASAPSEKPCERGMRGAASLCQLLSAGLWTEAAGAFDRASEPAGAPVAWARAIRPGEWRGAPPFRPPRSSM